MKYYRLREDVCFPGRWHLGDIRFVDNWLFRDPPQDFLEPGSNEVEVRVEGAELDFSLTVRYGVPVVSGRFIEALTGLHEIDEPHNFVVFNSLEILSERETEAQYFTMAIESQADCVNESSSRFEKFEENDPIRPDLAGSYKAFTELAIYEDKCKGLHFFRLKKHLGAIIVSEEVKKKLEAKKITGVVFEDLKTNSSAPSKHDQPTFN